MDGVDDMDIKHLLLIFLILLLLGTAQAACLDRRDSLRVVSFRQAGLDVSGNARIDEAAANLYVNMAIQRVSADFSAVVKHRSFQLTEYVSIYLTDTLFDSLLSCVFRDSVTGVRKTLRKVPYDFDWDVMTKAKIPPKDTTETTFLPEYVIIAGDSLKIYPAPKFNDYLEITYSVIGTKLLADDSTTDVSPAYRDLIVLWAAYLISFELGLYEQAARLTTEYDKRYARSQKSIGGTVQ